MRHRTKAAASHHESEDSDPSVSTETSALIASINDAAVYCRTLWATFITYLATLFILVSGTTQDDLLREAPVKMPFFELGVPLRLFFIIAPLLLLLLHLNLLMKFNDLRTRIYDLRKDFSDDEAQRLLRPRLLAFDYALLVGRLVADPAERWFQRVTTNMTVFVFPILLLLYVEMQFLPFHSAAITWTHRAILLIDFILILIIHIWFGMAPHRSVKLLALHALWPLLPSALLAAGVAIFIVAFPGEPVDILWRSDVAGRDPAERYGISRTLNLPGRPYWAKDPPPEIVAAFEQIQANQSNTKPAAADDPDTLALGDAQLTADLRYGVPINLNGRDLSYANLSGSALRSAGLAGTSLKGADLARTSLTGADMSGADLSGADLSGAEMVGVSLKGSSLTAADFSYADLRVADLSGSSATAVSFEGASLDFADLSAIKDAAAAMFDNAHMVGTRLDHSRLFAAHFRQSDVFGATFTGSNLTLTDFSDMRDSDMDLDNFLPTGTTSGTEVKKEKIADEQTPEAKYIESLKKKLRLLIMSALPKTGLRESAMGRIGDAATIGPTRTPDFSDVFGGPVAFGQTSYTPPETDDFVSKIKTTGKIKDIDPTDFDVRYKKYLVGLACSGPTNVSNAIAMHFGIFGLEPDDSSFYGWDYDISDALAKDACVKSRLSPKVLQQLEQTLKQHPPDSSHME